MNMLEDMMNSQEVVIGEVSEYMCKYIRDTAEILSRERMKFLERKEDHYE